MTLLNEICDSSRLVCVFFPNILLDRGNSCQFLAKSRMTLWRERAGGREARVQLEESSCRGGRLGADSCGREMQKQKGWKEHRTPVSDAFWALLDGSLLCRNLTFDGFV